MGVVVVVVVVLAAIEAQEKAAAVVELVVQLGVEVVEVIVVAVGIRVAAPVLGAFHRRLEEGGRHEASAQREGGPALADGAFDVQLVRQRADVQ